MILKFHESREGKKQETTSGRGLGFVIHLWCRLLVVTEINTLLDCEQDNSHSNHTILADKDSKLDLDYLSLASF